MRRLQNGQKDTVRSPVAGLLLLSNGGITCNQVTVALYGSPLYAGAFVCVCR